MASTARMVHSTCASRSPTCATSWLPGRIDAVPDTSTRRQPGVRSSTAREKLEPYSKAGHCSGLGSGVLTMPPGTRERAANAPSTIFAPLPFDHPIPVDAGTKRSNAPRSRKKSSRALLTSAYQSSIPSAYSHTRATSAKSMLKPASAASRRANAECACSRGTAETSAGPTPLTSA